MSTPKYEVVVGYPADSGEHEGGGITLAELAAIHDLGAPAAGIPARPFLRQSVFNRRERYMRGLAADLRRVYAGQATLDYAYGRLALDAAAGVQEEITNPVPAFVELKPATVARKGSSTPLIDSGQLRQSVQGIVRRAGETK
ncbi:hypothetical protein AB4Y36_38050 [Paraburkholderia sp. BR10936]|uniref:hypothetical protein n=1 Tax=Paraburkholderia sp. BR10936 TaxID=3236993 RepID=UPI0034D346FE